MQGLPDYDSLIGTSHIDTEALIAGLLVDMTCADSDRRACRAVMCRDRGTGVLRGVLQRTTTPVSRLETKLQS